MPDTRLETFVRRGPELTAAELHALLRLRVDVFVVEQDCPYHEIDGLDLRTDTEHLWFEDDRGVTAYLRLLGVGTGDVRVGRVVTRSDQRGGGVAASIIDAALERLGPVETRLEAQSHLVGYYGRFGYEVDGAEYLEDGIPHTPMRRAAPARTADNSEVAP